MKRFSLPGTLTSLRVLLLCGLLFDVNSITARAAESARLPTARRCYDLGRTLREILDERPERVAIYGSGGLSHDPVGPRAGWIDQPLDRFLLQALADGKPEKLLGLYTFDSDTVRSGTGEIRNWITVAGALHDRRATIVDYIPAYHAVTGLGFAAWPPVR